MLKLKKMDIIAGNLHYQCQNRGDHLYIEESKIKKKLPDEFEIPFEQWDKYFTCISMTERTEQDFKDDEEAIEYFKEIDKGNKQIETKLKKHGKECRAFRDFMGYGYKSYSIENGVVDLRPFLRKFEVCPFCREEFNII